MQRLPQTTQLLYVELLQQSAVALPNQRGISFVPKTVSGHRYWYMELVVGSTTLQQLCASDAVPGVPAGGLPERRDTLS